MFNVRKKLIQVCNDTRESTFGVNYPFNGICLQMVLECFSEVTLPILNLALQCCTAIWNL